MMLRRPPARRLGAVPPCPQPFLALKGPPPAAVDLLHDGGVSRIDPVIHCLAEIVRIWTVAALGLDHGSSSRSTPNNHPRMADPPPTPPDVMKQKQRQQHSKAARQPASSRLQRPARNGTRHSSSENWTHRAGLNVSCLLAVPAPRLLLPAVAVVDAMIDY